MKTLELSDERIRGDLYGRDGTNELGLVREYRDDKAEHRGQANLVKVFIAVVGAVQVVLGAVMVAKQLHLLN